MSGDTRQRRLEPNFVTEALILFPPKTWACIIAALYSTNLSQASNTEV